MNIRKHSLGTVLAVLGTSALAATQSLPLPPASGYVDTESSTNILFVGFNYDNWLTNRAVGIDQENGIYKATVTIAELSAVTTTPSSSAPTYLVCGPYKVAVSGVGTYSFPLEVFEHYPTQTYPEALPLDIAYDDGLNVPDESADSYAAAPRQSECIIQSTFRAARVALRGSRMAEIESAEAADIFTILIRHDNESIEASGEIYDDRPTHYCDDTCICYDCLWCYSSTNRYTEASVTNSCPCCTCL